MDTEQTENMDIDNDHGPVSPGSLKKKRLSNGADCPENGIDHNGKGDGGYEKDDCDSLVTKNSPCEINGDGHLSPNGKADNTNAKITEKSNIKEKCEDDKSKSGKDKAISENAEISEMSDIKEDSVEKKSESGSEKADISGKSDLKEDCEENKSESGKDEANSETAEISEKSDIKEDCVENKDDDKSEKSDIKEKSKENKSESCKDESKSENAEGTAFKNKDSIHSRDKNSDQIKKNSKSSELVDHSKSGRDTPDESDDSEVVEEKMDTDSDLKTIELSDTELVKDTSDDSGKSTPNVKESENEDGKEPEEEKVEKSVEKESEKGDAVITCDSDDDISELNGTIKKTVSTGEKDQEMKDSGKGIKGESASVGSVKSLKTIVCDDDDIEIVGESKVVNVSTPYSLSSSQNVVFVPANPVSSSLSSLSLLQQGLSANNLISPRGQRPGIFPGQQGIGALPPGFVLNSTGLSAQIMTPTVAPPKPKSSLDQIELIRWEIHNRVNTRPKYFKPSPTSELGPLSKFLCDIGSDLTKESVYHGLVKIQSKKNDDDTLSEKEREDLQKLKEIDKDLQATIGHLKFKLKKRCRTCNFQTESLNVMHLHKQFPHEDGKILNCAHCKYSSKQPMSFKFHMETDHNVQPRLQDKKAFHECDMCPYENNQEQKVVLHKQRCIKQFRPHFNLHPSCLSGAEINLCLENIFYKPIVPKNLKLLQQKHAQQQAALAEARRQQAHVQALAAQKNAAAQLKKQQMQKQQQQLLKLKQLQRLQQIRQPLPVTSRPGLVNNKVAFSPLPPVSPAVQSARSKTGRPTVASMLNNRQSIPSPQGPNPPPAPVQPANNVPGSPKGFEVCELCGGYVKDRKALRIHFFYAHRIDLPFNLFERLLAPLYCATCYIRFWTAQGLRKHIDTHKEENQTTGVVGKCISCGHHVLNLLQHMRIVHNREMQHYINALMCMFCPSHFKSKDEVEQHIKSVHGNIDPKTGVIKNVQNVGSSQKQATKKSTKSSSNQPPVKGSVCVLCNLNFGRNVDLTRHCMKMHHTCMKCGMVVIDKPSLLKHACLSSPSGTRDCNMCQEIGFHPAYFVKHLRDKHLKKFSININRLSKKTIETWTKRPFKDEETERIVEISDSSDDENADKPSVTATMSKKPRIGPASVMKKYRQEETEKVSDSDVVNIDDEVDDSVKSNEDGNDKKESEQEEEQKGASNEEANANASSSGRKRKSANPMSLTSKRQKSA